MGTLQNPCLKISVMMRDSKIFQIEAMEEPTIDHHSIEILYLTCSLCSYTVQKKLLRAMWEDGH